VEQLAASGVVEMNVISQDTISYGRDLAKTGRESLAALATRIADVKGVRWVRLFYLYPETIDDALIDVLANHPRVVPYVDMPLQHAADAMLKRMKRGHGKDRQKRVVERLRKAIPDLTFRTAFIVGHPGETDDEFAELCDFIEWARFERVGVFRYSDEETCASHGMDAKVSKLVASNRYRRLMAIQRRIAREANARLVGKELEVLVEGPSEEHEFVMKGRHAGQAPEIDGSVFLSGGEARAGEMRRVVVSRTEAEAPGPRRRRSAWRSRSSGATSTEADGRSTESCRPQESGRSWTPLMEAVTAQSSAWISPRSLHASRPSSRQTARENGGASRGAPRRARSCSRCS
jgi:ribosomal protein S12 methylthiotransferase